MLEPIETILPWMASIGWSLFNWLTWFALWITINQVQFTDTQEDLT